MIYFNQRELKGPGHSTPAAVPQDNDRHARPLAMGDALSLERTILQAAMDGFWLVDGEGRIVEVNEAYCRMSGYTRQELLTMSIASVESQESANDIAAHIRKVIAEGGDRFESRHRRKDGSIFEVEVSVQAHPAVSGQIVAFLRDITGRKRAERELRDSRALLANAFNNSPLLMTISELSTGRYLEVNDTFCRVSEFSREEVIGKSPPELGWLGAEGRGRLRDALQKDGTVAGLELDLRSKSGKPIICRYWGDIVPTADGDRLFSTAEDITDRKRAEAERADLQAQLQQAQKMESVGRLAGGVAHDFNNMLGVIVGHAELAMRQVRPSTPVYDDLEAIRGAAGRSADLTRQLLAFARKQAVTPRVLNLNDTVSAMLAMLQRLIGENVQIGWIPCERLWAVKVDPSQVDQVLANLCVNARDAIAGVGKIIIETGNSALDEEACARHTEAAPGEYVWLSVTDNGTGMDKETLAHIFEPFFTTKPVGTGTGLGLATVYGIVKQNRGFIDVESEPSQGTTLRLYLPRHRAKADSPSKSQPVAAAATEQRTILLVEDEPAILQLTTRMLALLGYSVLSATSPGEALRVAREYTGPIHLVMTDVVMPEMNGRDLASAILSMFPSIKRLFMSGYTADVIAHHGVIDEGVTFLQKPFNTEELAKRVREALSLASAARTEA